MKRLALISVLFLAVVVLAACSNGSEKVAGAAAPVQTGQNGETAAPVPDPPPAAPAVAVPDETLVDEQGAIAVSVKPLSFDLGAATIDFEVALNTHSVDLSMDLAALATLTTDTGKEVAASSWDAPLGGHHATGVLSFPAASEEGRLLDGALTLTLTLVGVDAPARTFTWNLQ
ncbi:MAG: hypothetical protein RRC07_01300 [Anaerolineae bacterium]|nr:hypothetical protein [Anaerolineae bacterium]